MGQQQASLGRFTRPRNEAVQQRRQTWTCSFPGHMGASSQAQAFTSSVLQEQMTLSCLDRAGQSSSERLPETSLGALKREEGSDRCSGTKSSVRYQVKIVYITGELSRNAPSATPPKDPHRR